LSSITRNITVLKNSNEQKQDLRRYLHDAIRSGYRYDHCVPYKMVFVSIQQARAVNTATTPQTWSFKTGGSKILSAALRMKISWSDFAQHRIPQELLPPLFEPVLVKMTEKQMTLHWYAIEAEDRVVAHYSQYWVLRMVERSVFDLEVIR
jgi:hypothetical protein